ncbi:hypothetical protein [Roseateles sp.]|uniref:hypothetical protein n=1 Tax=Roseateles sp. TaxID=1971397 RepID=UPI00286A3844|nr:hypothetical protein [Roseateles sp.]
MTGSLLAPLKDVIPEPDAGDGGDGNNTLELYLGESRQLFNSMDPAPFRKRDLDPKAADYIVDWARAVPAGSPLNLIVHLGQESASADDAVMLREAMQDYFKRRAVDTRKSLRRLLRVGRISLLVGVTFLGAVMLLTEAAARLLEPTTYGTLIKESLSIGAWVALWHPADILLHQWWPILGEARLLDRLCAINVRLYSADNAPHE